MYAKANTKDALYASDKSYFCEQSLIYYRTVI